jgi:predicted ArsR family transcriptional regulator
MSKLPDRIVAAVRLVPMTVTELARCLSSSKSPVRRYVEDLVERGQLIAKRDARIRKSGRPAQVFGVPE